MNECSAPNLVTITLYFYKFYYIQIILLRTIDPNAREAKKPHLVWDLLPTSILRHSFLTKNLQVITLIIINLMWGT